MPVRKEQEACSDDRVRARFASYLLESAEAENKEVIE